MKEYGENETVVEFKDTEIKNMPKYIKENWDRDQEYVLGVGKHKDGHDVVYIFEADSVKMDLERVENNKFHGDIAGDYEGNRKASISYNFIQKAFYVKDPEEFIQLAQNDETLKDVLNGAYLTSTNKETRYSHSLAKFSGIEDVEKIVNRAATITKIETQKATSPYIKYETFENKLNDQQVQNPSKAASKTTSKNKVRDDDQQIKKPTIAPKK